MVIGAVVTSLSMTQSPLTRAIDMAVTSANAASAPGIHGEGDHQNMMDQLGIKALRPGANPNNQATFDEATANKYPLPELMTLKNGKRVTTARQWKVRRAEIVEDFEREVYGRIPKQVPKVTWEVTSTNTEDVGGIPAITKKLVGHVDNSSYPLITVDIEANVTTPAGANGSVPVMVEIGGFRRPGPPRAPAPGPGGAPTVGAPPPPNWRELLIKKGWGYASINPTSIQADGPALTSESLV